MPLSGTLTMSSLVTRWIVLLTFALVGIHVVAAAMKRPTVNVFTIEEQRRNIDIKQRECQNQIHNQPKTDETQCPIDFDGALCWPASTPNTTVVIQCPDYVSMVNFSANATRKCLANGTWNFNYTSNKNIVNYVDCIKLTIKPSVNKNNPDILEQPPYISAMVQEHLANIQMIITVGYSTSVLSLCIALSIMLLLRRLHCPRNTIHMHMFVSFILRGVINLLENHLTHNTAKHEYNQYTQTEDGLPPLNENYGWGCKVLATIWMYTRLSNCVWIFIEGFYLHMLIFINTFSDKSSIRWFILLGWGSPLLAVIPWMLVRIYLDDLFCWTVYKHRPYRWIIEAPIVLLIVVNFIFFILIIRLLFTKLRASESSSREIRIYRYIKLAKSTLVLIPLFGAHYIVFLFAQFFDISAENKTDVESKSSDTIQVIRFYFDSLFTSFQGLMVSILFCFINGEVRAELKKKWKRWRSQNFLPSTQTTIVGTANQKAERTSVCSADIDSTANRSRHSPTSIIQIPIPEEPENTHLLSKQSTPISSFPREMDATRLLTLDDNQNVKGADRSTHSHQNAIQCNGFH